MSSSFGFIEYSFNPHSVDIYYVEKKLRDLGFINRTVHSSGLVTIWNQQNCILLVKETDKVTEPGVTGIAVMAPSEIVQNLNPVYDEDIGMYYVTDNTGLRIILISDDATSSMDAQISENYSVIDSSSYTDCDLDHISGLLLGSITEQQHEFYKSLGFKTVKQDDCYTILIDNNNRFSLVFNNICDPETPKAILCESKDVFRTVVKYSIKNIEMSKYCELESDDIGALNHRIGAYGCVGYGNIDSYNISRKVPDALTNLDLIFRTRRKYMGIKDRDLDTYYEFK